ncbi:MAG: putative DNA binding domain-containing protein [Synergistaceae bacterium]|jgi:predicted HTH transcriptional regulator|nr:putative DNA binding domain-containing protein [Synergistaceae bacterium]
MFDTTDELLRQIRLGEDSSLELKDLRYKGNRVAEPRRDDIADEFAAMANSAAGVFVFGVDDKSKTIAGIPVDKLEAVETWVREICNDSINPPLFCRIRKIPLINGGGEERCIVRVDIPRSIFVHKSPHGYFNRTGSSKREMEPDVLARLFQQRSQSRLIRFDEQVVPSVSKNTLDRNLWEKFRTPLSPSGDEEFLCKMKLLSQNEDGEVFPTVSGILMASEKPREYLANAFIQAVAYRGTERNAAYQLDARDIVGPLDAQIAAAYRFVKKNMRVYAVKNPARREIPQFSMNAVFEALVNAAAHRDYSIQSSKIRVHLFADRLEIFSPGTITNTMTLDSLPLRQSARNELLTSLLARCPLNIESYTGNREFIMDKRGEGVPIILVESKKLSGLRPEYRLIDDAELMLTIYAANPEREEK